MTSTPHESDAVFEVTDDADAGRFELRRDDGLVGFATYRDRDGVLVIAHVETLVAHRGQGYANRLMDGVVDIVRESGRKIVPLCPYAAGYLSDHPEHQELVAADW